MPKMIGINIGFITNSSSCVHHFPKALLDDPKIKFFLEALEVEDGFLGADLWNRSQCGSLLVTKEQKEAALQQLSATEYGGVPHISLDDDTFVTIYGDEYKGIASTLTDMLEEACKRLGIPCGGGDEYN